MPQTVCVDFDGVIHAYSNGWHDGSIYDGPVDGALDALRALMERYAVVVHTTRDPAPVVAWLTGFGFPAEYFPDDSQSPPFWRHQSSILVTNRKIAAVAYIDDRGIRFTDWDQALADLESLAEFLRPLCDALVRYFTGTEDTRALRRDYDAERKRVDALIGHLATVTRSLAEPQP